jgi:hypothetical protein
MPILGSWHICLHIFGCKLAVIVAVAFFYQIIYYSTEFCGVAEIFTLE